MDSFGIVLGSLETDFLKNSKNIYGLLNINDNLTYLNSRSSANRCLLIDGCMSDAGMSTQARTPSGHFDH